MKKLFSIALVIAMAISCLAIFPSAWTNYADGAYCDIVGEFKENNTIFELTLTLEATVTNPATDTFTIEWYGGFDNAEALAWKDISWTGIADDQIDVYETDPAAFALGVWKCDWDANNYVKATITIRFDVKADAGESFTYIDDASSAQTDINEKLTFAETEVTFTVPAAAPSYEAPASAMAQELAGCEVCGVEAGVRFIATVDKAATEFGMYITANGKTYTLSSETAGFNVKADTEETVTFTAVIFSDLTFEVVVFEKYGDTEVKSDAVRN